MFQQYLKQLVDFFFHYPNFSLNILVPKPIPPVKRTSPTWDDEYEPSDVAQTVVESTLAEV